MKRKRESHPLTASEKRRLASVGVLNGVIFGAVLGFIYPALNGSQPVWLSIVTGLLSGLVFGSIMTLFIARSWRQAGGPVGPTVLGHALRTRKLPADADPTEWSSLLARQDMAIGRYSLYVAFLVIIAAAYLVLALTGALPGLGPVAWVGVVLFAAVAIYGPFEARSRRARVRALREQLDARSFGSSG